MLLALATSCRRHAPPPPPPVPPPSALPVAADASTDASSDAGFSGPRAMSLAVGEYLWLARMNDGTVWSWGRNDRGQSGKPAGAPEGTPAPIPGLADVVEVAAKSDHACAVQASGKLVCWGSDEKGQLGLGAPTLGTDHVPPTVVPGIDDVVDVAVGMDHTCAVRRDGTVWCFGGNDFGELGRGTADFDGHPKPARVAGIADAESVAIADSTTCARLRSGRVRCWALNNFGQVGQPRSLPPASPVPFGAVDSAIDVALGGYATCALLRDGTLRCAGQDDDDQLGPTKETCTTGLLFTETHRCRSYPGRVAGVADAVAVALGSKHACAVERSREVVCWGSNEKGQLASLALASSDKPVTIAGLSGIAQIGASGSYTMALDREGRVFWWGLMGLGWLTGSSGHVERVAGIGPP